MGTNCRARIVGSRTAPDMCYTCTYISKRTCVLLIAINIKYSNIVCLPIYIIMLYCSLSGDLKLVCKLRI